MKRLEFKYKLDKLYSEIEEAEEEIRSNIRRIESVKNELGTLADSLEDGGFDDEGNDQETSKG